MARPKALTIQSEHVASPSLVAEVAAYIRDVLVAAGGDALGPEDVTTVVSNLEMKAELRCYTEGAWGLAATIMATAEDPHSVARDPNRIPLAEALANLPREIIDAAPCLDLRPRQRRQRRGVVLDRSFRDVMKAAAAAALGEYESVMTTIAFDSPVLRVGRANEGQREETCRLLYRGRPVDAAVTATTRDTVLHALDSGAWCRLRCDGYVRVTNNHRDAIPTRLVVTRATPFVPLDGESFVQAIDSLSQETRDRLAAIAEDMH